MSDKKEGPLVVYYEELLREADKNPVGKFANFLWKHSFLGQLYELGKVLSGYGGLTEDDAENVRRIIKAGRDEGVDEMEIEMSREQWMGLKGKVDQVDADVGFGTGGKTGYRVEVKYK